MYQLNTKRFGTHHLIASEIGSDKIVLDVGCSSGYLKQLAPHNVFYGIDQDTKHLEQAERVAGYEKVFAIDVQHFEQFVTEKKFDVIVFADVLEHLTNRERALDYFVKQYLKPEGIVIISLPNVANIIIRLGLLFGKFDYTESGILDQTHVRLYTLKSAREFIRSCQLKITREKFSSDHLGWLLHYFPSLGKLLGYNLIFVCRPRSL